MKLCTDCLHCEKNGVPPEDSYKWTCNRPPDINPVTGIPYSQPSKEACFRERNDLVPHGCGSSGRFFQAN
jgi:hypothetical protein